MSQIFMLSLLWGWSPAFILSGLLLLMAVLTNMVSNNAAAVIGTPIAISIAYQLALPAGNYTFWDFIKVGGPLTLLLWLLFSFLLPWLYSI